jgi:predicted MPP superfamily phosphohydrolase
MFFLASWAITLALFGITYRWAVDSFPALGRRRVAVFLAALWLGQPLIRWVVVHAHVGDSVQAALLIVSMTVAIAAIPIGAMRGGWWLARRLRAPADPAPQTAGSMTRRQAVEGATGVALYGATGSMLAWGAVRGRHAFEIREVPVRIPGLPRALDGYVIAQVSDIHTGTLVSERVLDEGFSRLREARADLVVATGDLVDMDEAFAPAIARKLADSRARDGVVAILGNHDHYAGADSVAAALRAAGVEVLINAGKVVRPGDGGGFALLGVDDVTASRRGRPGPLLDRAIAMVPEEAPRILLSHNPISVDMWAGRVALQLSGHTHGGQINPGFRPAELLLRYVAGRYDVGGTQLYVNRGFGTVGPPSRVGAPPEVTRIVLVAA